MKLIEKEEVKFYYKKIRQYNNTAEFNKNITYYSRLVFNESKIMQLSRQKIHTAV